MFQKRNRPEPLLPGLLITLLLALPACSGEKAATQEPSDGATEAATTQNPPAKAAPIKLPDSEAGSVVAAALEEAMRTNRNVFAHTGADW
jgi:hypothetical protein